MKAPTAPSLQAQPQSLRAGDVAFARMEKVNAELVAITYGALVSQLLDGRPVEESHAIHADLEKVGFNMGTRMIDEFLSKFGTPTNCQSFKESMDVLSKVAVKMFLGVDADLTEVSPKCFVLSFQENPLNDFVELPPALMSTGFSYCAIYCGIIKGAFEQLHMKVACMYLKDTLRGDDTNAIQVELVSIIRPDEDE